MESGGAALPHQANVFPDKEHFGRIFYNMVRQCDSRRITHLTRSPGSNVGEPDTPDRCGARHLGRRLVLYYLW